MESPYFEARKSVFDEPNESIEHNLSSEGPSTRDLRGTTSSGGQSSSSRSEFYDPAGRPSEFLRETPSPSSGKHGYYHIASNIFVLLTTHVCKLFMYFLGL